MKDHVTLKTGVMMVKIQLCHKIIRLHCKIFIKMKHFNILNCNSISQYYCFYKCSLGEHKTERNRTDPKLLKGRVIYTMFEQTLIPFRWTSLFPDRIDANVEDTQLNVDLAHTEILKYFQSVSSNRWLLIKIFLILIIFFIVFVVFMTWSSLLRGVRFKESGDSQCLRNERSILCPFFFFSSSLLVIVFFKMNGIEYL